MSTGQCMSQRAAIHVFEFATDRHAMGNVALLHLISCCQFGNHMRGGFALDSCIRRENRLFH